MATASLAPAKTPAPAFFRNTLREPAVPQLWIDNRLCRDGVPDYSVAGRSCGGSDGVGFRTVAGALTAAAPGDRVFARAGTHTGLADYSDGGPRRQASFLFAKPVTVEAYSGEPATLTFDPASPPLQDANDWGYVCLVRSPGVVLRGLTITGTHSLGDSPGGADTDVSVLVDDGASATLDGCTLTDFGHCGVKTYSGGPVRLVNTRILGGGFTGRDHGVYCPVPFRVGRLEIIGGEITGCAGYGVHLYGPPADCVLDGIHVHHNGGDYAMAGGGGLLVGGLRTLVQNCTIEDNIGYGGIVLWKADCTGSVLIGNAIRRNAPRDVTFDASGPVLAYANARGPWTPGLGTPQSPDQWPDGGSDTVGG